MAAIRLKSNYVVESIPGEGFILVSESCSFALEGPYLPPIIPLLIDGRLTVEEIVRAVQPTLTAEQALSALDVLRQAGHLEETSAEPAEFAAFWSEIGISIQAAAAVLKSSSVEWSTHGRVDPNPFVQTTAGYGISTSVNGNIHVAITDDYLRPGLYEINRHCLATKKPLLIVKPTGVRLWIGPLVLPGQSACWRCFESRLRGNREVEGFIERRSGRRQPIVTSRARVPLAEHQAAAMVATQLARFFVTGTSPALTSRVLIADIIDFGFDYHTLVKRPQCPDCGDVQIKTRAGMPIRIASQLATTESTSGLRRAEPEETYRRYQHHISPVTGLVREVSPSIWHGEGPLRVYMAGHNFALKNDHLFHLKDGLRTSSSGKGRTDAQARTSALCEALERYSGLFRGEEPVVHASYKELGADAVDPRSCMMFSDTQYREREQWLARKSRFQIVPLPFREDAAIDWSPTWSLTKGTVRYLPTSYLYYNYTQTVSDHFFCWADSNGAAAGGTLEEAMLQGLLEIVERDSVALWWYNRVRRPAVDLAAFDDPFLLEVSEFYKAHDREYWVLDLTADTGIPSFVAINRRTKGPTEDIMLGFGAHTDPKAAVLRAVTEMNQFIPAVLTVRPDGTTAYAIHDHDAISWWQTATVENQPYLVPDPSTPARTPSDFPGIGSPTELHDIGLTLKSVIRALEKIGHEVLILDQTRPDIGLPVCKTIVPGMRHFWARFGPGRLYDAPVRLGWLPRARTESELNPIPMFL